MWPNNRFHELTGVELPIIQAPMAGASGSAMAIGVSQAGGVGSLPCAMLNAESVRTEYQLITHQTDKPINLNFFCHKPLPINDIHSDTWHQELHPFYDEFGIDKHAAISTVNRAPFDETMCQLVEEIKPAIISFHFGLPSAALVSRVKAAGCLVLSSATTVEEACWLESHGCDAIIAQGAEAGGHRGIFLSEDISSQSGTFALVPQVVDAVKVPVIAAGGIADGRGIAAAFTLGASAVQIGTTYLFTSEALITDLHRTALSSATDNKTALTNVFSGRPARSLINRIMREVGPMSDKAAPFPTAGSALAPLKSIAEKKGLSDFSSLWSGQSAKLGNKLCNEITMKTGGTLDAQTLTCQLGADALQQITANTQT